MSAVGVGGTLRLMNLVTARLTEVMVDAGFEVSGPLDGRPAEEFTGRHPDLRRLWFAAPG
ncbi:hypothetical protein APR12_004803 [Nocardia amikacinitolerans]|nr:hypothetical protein [Nocardia amikacinitolerans]